MNREKRRQLMKQLKSNGVNKAMVKEYVNDMFLSEQLAVGDKVKFDWEKMTRSPEWKHLLNAFRDWCTAHKDDTFTVSGTTDNGHTVQFEEDDNKAKYNHNSMYLIKMASAKIKLDDGTEKLIDLGDITDMNDPSIMEKVNEVIGNEGEN